MRETYSATSLAKIYAFTKMLVYTIIDIDTYFVCSAIVESAGARVAASIETRD